MNGNQDTTRLTNQYGKPLPDVNANKATKAPTRAIHTATGRNQERSLVIPGTTVPLVGLRQQMLSLVDWPRHAGPATVVATWLAVRCERAPPSPDVRGQRRNGYATKASGPASISCLYTLLRLLLRLDASRKTVEDRLAAALLLLDRGVPRHNVGRRRIGTPDLIDGAATLVSTAILVGIDAKRAIFTL